MKNGFRQSMAWLHTYCGLLVGWVLFFIFVTGCSAYWRSEISHWMKPETHASALQPITAQRQAQQLGQAVQWLQQNAAGSPRWFINLPSAREPVISLFWLKPKPDPAAGRNGRFGNATLDASGQPLTHVRETRGGDFLYRLHFDLHYMPPIWGRWIVGFCAMFMLVAIVSGIVTHKRIFADFFTFRPKKGQRSWLDAHNASAVLALPYHLMITYTGLCTLMFMYMPWAPQAAYPQGGLAAYRAEAQGRRPPAKPALERAPLTDLPALLADAQRRWQAAGHAPLAARVIVELPGDAAATVAIALQTGQDSMGVEQPELHYSGTSGAFVAARGDSPGAAMHTFDVMEGLHTARFAGPLLRALFFISGLLGCAMVATGLLLWAVKERPQHLKALKRGEKGSRALRLVDGLNLGAVGGLLVAVPAYFWANRLIPAGMAQRADAEIRVFFAVWAACLLIGLARPTLGMWKAMTAAAGTLLALVPLLNAATGGAHWGQSLAAGLWPVAGFDAVCLLLGAGLLAAVRWIGQRQAANAQAAAKAAAKATGPAPVNTAPARAARTGPAALAQPPAAPAQAPADTASPAAPAPAALAPAADALPPAPQPLAAS